MTPGECVENAARLLRAAEVETNPVTMERLDEMSMSWLRLAEFLAQNVEVQK